MNRQQAYKRGVKDAKRHGQGINCPFKPGWQRTYWLMGWRRQMEVQGWGRSISAYTHAAAGGSIVRVE